MLVVLDASTVVGAALKAESIPRQALLLARERHAIALSAAVFGEVTEVLNRPKFARALTAEQRDEVLGLLTAAAIWSKRLSGLPNAATARTTSTWNSRPRLAPT